MTGQPEHFGDSCGNNGRTVTDGQHAVHRPIAKRIDNGGHRAALVVKMNRNRVIRPRVVEHLTAIGRKHQLDAEAFRCLAKRSRLIAGRRRQQEHALDAHLAVHSPIGILGSPVHAHYC